MPFFRSGVLFFGFIIFLSAGERYVSPLNTYFRVYAIVPMVGSATATDPIRPMYAPTAAEIGRPSGILGFTSQLSDDGTTALIEIVARDRFAVAKMLADPSIQTFVKGIASPATIEAAFQPHKARFSFSTFDEVPAR